MTGQELYFEIESESEWEGSQWEKIILGSDWYSEIKLENKGINFQELKKFSFCDGLKLCDFNPLKFRERIWLQLTYFN